MGNDSGVVVVGDNIVAGHGLKKRLGAAGKMQGMVMGQLFLVIMLMIRNVSVLLNLTVMERLFLLKKNRNIQRVITV